MRCCVPGLCASGSALSNHANTARLGVLTGNPSSSKTRQRIMLVSLRTLCRKAFSSTRQPTTQLPTTTRYCQSRARTVAMCNPALYRRSWLKSTCLTRFLARRASFGRCLSCILPSSAGMLVSRIFRGVEHSRLRVTPRRRARAPMKFLEAVRAVRHTLDYSMRSYRAAGADDLPPCVLLRFQQGNNVHKRTFDRRRFSSVIDVGVLLIQF